MERKLFLSEDGSHSFFVKGLGETYHSKFGAIQESDHIFIKNGLGACIHKHIKIIEMGFGTGLNAFLSLGFAREHNLLIDYHTIEKYPLNVNEYKMLNYPMLMGDTDNVFNLLHTAVWNEKTTITPFFQINKILGDCRDIGIDNNYDLVYYDAFGPDVQPKLWTIEVLNKFFMALNKGGIFVTYSAKGHVRRVLQECGFTIERLKGPPGKREILRGTK